MSALKNTKGKHLDTLFLVVILFFTLSMIHIAFAWLGLICMILPFILYYQSKEKLWCKYYCPRASFFLKILNKISFGMKIPKWMKAKDIKIFVVYYFAINLFFATMSSIMVSTGRMEPLNFVRIFMLFKAPFTLPQLFNWSTHPGLLHASYRIYSMMFTSTITGLIIGMLYKPRTWCMICPIQTLTTKNPNNK